MKANVIKVGMIGCGFMGMTHSEAVTRYIPNARLVAVAGGSRAQSLADKYHVTAEDSVEALIRRGDVDAVYINTPHDSHAEYTVLAAESGKHVFVEKPMATTLEGCDAMIGACRKASVNLMVGYFQRYRKANSMAKKLIDEGKIGKVLAIWETHLSVNGIQGLPKWQRSPENVGTLIGYGVHSLDKILWWVDGWDTLETVFARCGAIREKVPVEASSLVLMKFKDGVTASLWCSYECPPPGFPASGLRAQVMGTEGLLDVDSYGELKLGVEDKWETLYVQPKVDWSIPGAMLSEVRIEAYAACDQEFISSITEEREPTIPGEEGKASVQAAIAAYESSRLGKAIPLPL